MIYHKFQTIIITVFVLGLLDVLAFSDLITAIMAIPEFAPILITAIIVLGIVVYFVKRKGKKKTK
jgi:hypothetical protein